MNKIPHTLYKYVETDFSFARDGRTLLVVSCDDFDLIHHVDSGSSFV